MTPTYQLLLPIERTGRVINGTYLERLDTLLSQDLDFHEQDSGYASHNFHSFPAKFPPQLPRKFIQGLTEAGEVVVDPMVGSGTTVVETYLSGRRGIGFDIDPLALLVSKVKVTPLDIEQVARLGSKVLMQARTLVTKGQRELRERFAGRWDAGTRKFINVQLCSRSIQFGRNVLYFSQPMWPITSRRLLAVAFVIVSFLVGSCTGREPIRVGFSGEITGRRADLGVAGRNGVQLAVADLNAGGGIAGRPVELLIRDDQGTPEGARAADRELVDAGVVAIIGHMTSGQTVAALSVSAEAGVVLLSATTSTSELSGLDDLFFRVNPDNSSEARGLARRVYLERGLTRLAGIYDTDNDAYTETFWAAFVETYQALGGRVVGEVRFSSGETLDFAPLVEELKTGDPGGVLIIASALDTALIAQHVRLRDWQVPLFGSGWAQTEALLHNGGRAVEGIEMVMNYDLHSRSPDFVDFQTRYRERFGYEPAFAAAQSYEAMMFLAAALEKTGGQAEGLPQALLETRDFEGLTGPVVLNEYGDAIRTLFLITVRDGQFVTLKPVEP